MSKLKNNLLISILLSCIVMLLSCATTPVGKYQVLRDTSQSLLTSTTDTYTRVEKLQRRFVIITAPNNPIDRNTFKPQIEGQSFNLVPELQYREVAFDVLVKYLTVLSAFSSKDYMADIDKASLELSGSLQTLLERSKMVDSAHVPQVTGIFVTLIDTVSSPVIEAKRMNALKSIMDSSQGDLEMLSELIVGSNQKIKIMAEKMLERIIVHVNLVRPAYQSAPRYIFDEDIAEVIEEVLEMTSSLDTINAGVLKIPSAHKEIRSMLDEKPTTMEALKELVKETQRATKFYRSLNVK